MIIQAPAFFLPAATSENQEEVYAQLAQWCGRSVPPSRERIYAITFVHDGEEWTATVGQKLCGVKRKSGRKSGQRVERTIPITDPALVLAIFPGTPYMVVTNHRIGGVSVGSAWENPFMAGQPNSVGYFSEAR